MVITFPADAVPVALADPDAATHIASLIVQHKQDAYRADADAQARQIIDEAARADAFLLAMTTPPGADPAVLTGMSITVPSMWNTHLADQLRWSLADTGEPGIRDTVTVHTGVGPVVVIERTLQERPREARCWQLQAFLPEDATSMLLLTLSTVSARGWNAQRNLFVRMVASATVADTG